MDDEKKPDGIVLTEAQLRSRRHRSIAIALALGGCATVPAPTEQLAVSRAAVADAVSAGGGEYASLELRAAQSKLESAERAVAGQDYQRARALAEEAEVDARLAATRARSVKAQMAVDEVYASIRALQDELSRKPL